MKFDMVYGKENHYLWGFAMHIYGNTAKAYYPLPPDREHDKAPSTLLIGGIVGKEFKKQKHTKMSVQLELCYAVQNISSRTTNVDTDFIQWRGFTPGVVVNYQVFVGRDRMSHYYGAPIIFNNIMNLHAGIRPVFFNSQEASGLMMEIGLSYRMSFSNILSYELKQGR